ncbi:hypothetical protein EIP91_005395 [Steccherinum ochraceum]|uniref:BTB domain-containing protein n=1 Tax=Steccherinum ochraceum TaxID=92696 RepID=A0A4R0RMC4_9APHY|nr:hypothetical protein EIP91_005395 [Steccherinum ochraceum]
MNDVAGRNPKRARLDSDRVKLENSDVDDSDVKLVVHQNHPTLYFDDGNVLLSCESILFCVHRSIVSKHSPVLKALLDGPVKGTLRGLRHIMMQETPKDIETVLNVIYEGLPIDPKITVESSPFLSRILRMCTKFQINRPCQEILQLIHAEWSSKLPDHDAKMEALRQQRTKDVPTHIMQNGVSVRNPAYDSNAADEEVVINPASVIALLRECRHNLPVLLTPLFYALSRGTWQFGGPAVGNHIAPLSHADIERFIVGVERIRQQHADFVTQSPPIASIMSAHSQTCQAALRAYWATLALAMLKATYGSRQPVEDWASVIAQARTQKTPQSYGLCPGCTKAVLDDMETRRRRLWTDMPKHFELV